jgi:hypothetical protein
LKRQPWFDGRSGCGAAPRSATRNGLPTACTPAATRSVQRLGDALRSRRMLAGDRRREPARPAGARPC